MDGCLYAYRSEDWDTSSSRACELDPLSKEGRRMQRFFFSGATEAELDKQGRVMIPAASSSTEGSAGTSSSPA